MFQKLAVEFLGSLILYTMFFSVAIIQSSVDLQAVAFEFGVPVAFGLSYIALYYSFAYISGAHFNPIITIAMWIRGIFPAKQVLPYIAVQLLGTIGASLIIFLVLLASRLYLPGQFYFSNGFNFNSPGGYSLVSVMFAEVFSAMVLVIVFIGVNLKGAPLQMSGIAVGAIYIVLIKLTLPISYSGLNPFRSVATAIFSADWTISQLYLFILAPIIGAVIGAGISRIVK